MIAKNHLGLIKNNKVIIGKETITNLNVLSIIAKERRIYMQAFTSFSQELGYTKITLITP